MQFFKHWSSSVIFLLQLVSPFSVKAQLVRDYPLINSVTEINKGTPDTCGVTAFVASVYNCPPCPKGMICKPCPGNYIMIADSVNSKKKFRIYVHKTGLFSIAKKYSFIIRLYKYDSDAGVYEGKLIEPE